MRPYHQQLEQLYADAERVAKFTRDRVDHRIDHNRGLSMLTREQLIGTADNLEAVAADLRTLAEPEAGLSRRIEQLARRVVSV